MTNEELKKKIKEILRKRMTELLGSCHTDEIPLTEEGAEAILFYADEFADALIAAGIGDLKEHRIFAGKDGSIKQIYSDEEVEDIARQRDEYKHRAEVAERDKYLYCRSLYNLACKYVVSEHISTITGADGKSYIAGQEFCALCVMAEEAEQAKKELQEERKDD